MSLNFRTETIGFVSLGCSKNQVDLEILMAKIAAAGWKVTGNADDCDAVIINTCGFIEAAKEESIDTILEYCAQKGKGRLKCVLVTGCLAERYAKDLEKEIPEADGVVTIGSNQEITEILDRCLHGERVVSITDKYLLRLEGDRILANAPYFAYVKIAEGCSNRCAYCAIPYIRGDFRSRPMESILEEVQTLASRGVKEINLVAQDTSFYGFDLYQKSCLPELIHRVCAIEGIQWVRILYCYPDRITDELLDTIASEPKVVKYIDIPVQHGSGKVLREMCRFGDREKILELVQRMRQKIPGLVLRTTLIAGFPGETEDDFEELCLLVEQAKFERLGCFAYSQEEGTPAGVREDQIDEEIRRRRADRVMEIQMGIAFDFAESCCGKELDILVEGRRGHRYFGRSYMDAPDIDTRVLFESSRPLHAGEMVRVRITGSKNYDLTGELISEKEES
jgi:ribosomal protein S12 methylthiotransferase